VFTAAVFTGVCGFRPRVLQTPPMNRDLARHDTSAGDGARPLARFSTYYRYWRFS